MTTRIVTTGAIVRIIIVLTVLGTAAVAALAQDASITIRHPLVGTPSDAATHNGLAAIAREDGSLLLWPLAALSSGDIEKATIVYGSSINDAARRGHTVAFAGEVLGLSMVQALPSEGACPTDTSSRVTTFTVAVDEGIPRSADERWTTPIGGEITALASIGERYFLAALSSGRGLGLFDLNYRSWRDTPAIVGPTGAPCPSLRALALRPDGDETLIAAGSTDGILYLARTVRTASEHDASIEWLGTLRSNVGQPIQSLAFSPDGNALLLGYQASGTPVTVDDPLFVDVVALKDGRLPEKWDSGLTRYLRLRTAGEDRQNEIDLAEVAWAEDGETIVAAGSLRVMDDAAAEDPFFEARYAAIDHERFTIVTTWHKGATEEPAAQRVVGRDRLVTMVPTSSGKIVFATRDRAMGTLSVEDGVPEVKAIAPLRFDYRYGFLGHRTSDETPSFAALATTWAPYRFLVVTPNTVTSGGPRLAARLDDVSAAAAYSIRNRPSVPEGWGVQLGSIPCLHLGDPVVIPTPGGQAATLTCDSPAERSDKIFAVAPIPGFSDQVVVGSSNYVSVLRVGDTPIRMPVSAVPFGVMAVESLYGDIIFTTMHDDGVMRWWRYDPSAGVIENILNFFAFPDLDEEKQEPSLRSWAAWTPDGYFDYRGEENPDNVVLRRRADVLDATSSLEDWYRTLYCPDIISETLRLGDVESARQAARAVAAPGRCRPLVSPNPPTRNGAPTLRLKLDVDGMTTTHATVRGEFKFVDPEGGARVTRIEFRHANSSPPLATIRREDIDAFGNQTVEVRIPHRMPCNGTVTITPVAFSGDDEIDVGRGNVTSSTFTYSGAGKGKNCASFKRLWLFVAASNYEGALALKGAVNDGNAVVRLVCDQVRAGFWEEIVIVKTSEISAECPIDKVKTEQWDLCPDDAHDWFGRLMKRRVAKDDYVYIYIAGHGRGEEFDIKIKEMSDCSPEKKGDGYVGLNRILEDLSAPADLQGGNVVVFIDACRLRDVNATHATLKSSGDKWMRRWFPERRGAVYVAVFDGDPAREIDSWPRDALACEIPEPRGVFSAVLTDVLRSRPDPGSSFFAHDIADELLRKLDGAQTPFRYTPMSDLLITPIPVDACLPASN